MHFLPWQGSVGTWTWGGLYYEKGNNFQWAINLHAYYYRRRHYLHTFKYTCLSPRKEELSIILTSFWYLAWKLCKNVRDPWRIVFQHKPENKWPRVHSSIYSFFWMSVMCQGLFLVPHRAKNTEVNKENKVHSCAEFICTGQQIHN